MTSGKTLSILTIGSSRRQRERIIKPILRNNDLKLINHTKETDLKVQKVQSVSNKITQGDLHQDIL